MWCNAVTDCVPIRCDGNVVAAVAVCVWLCRERILTQMAKVVGAVSWFALWWLPKTTAVQIFKRAADLDQEQPPPDLALAQATASAEASLRRVLEARSTLDAALRALEKDMQALSNARLADGSAVGQGRDYLGKGS